MNEVLVALDVHLGKYERYLLGCSEMMKTASTFTIGDFYHGLDHYEVIHDSFGTYFDGLVARDLTTICK